MTSIRWTEKEAFCVQGLTVRTLNADEVSPDKAKIGDLWRRFFSEGISEKISQKTNPEEIFGVYFAYDTDEHGPYTVMAGHAVSPEAQAEGERALCKIPAQKYAVITSETGPMPDVLVQTWQEIWKMTEKDLGGRRTYAADFELYDHRAADLKNTQVDIYIGIE